MLMTLAQKLAALVRFRTVSFFDASLEDDSQFAGLLAALPELFPVLHSRAERFALGNRAVLYRLEGSDPTLKPIILCAHFDVVPAQDIHLWDEDPFGGAVRDGYLYGRGTQDIKVQMACQMEALEHLLVSGKAFSRTIYLAYGGDEEIGGVRGAARIAAWLEEHGIRATMLLDEGSPVADGIIGFVQQPLALIGVAEKGYMDVILETRGKGGHASMPPHHTALGVLARAIVEIEEHPFPAKLTRTTREFLDALARFSRSPYRLLFRFRNLLAPLILQAFTRMPSTNALIRTTCAPTMASASQKENVLPDIARAVINVRIMPGETSREVLERLKSLTARYGVSVHVSAPEYVIEPSAESSTSSEGWRMLVNALAISHPEAVAVPFLFTAGTDTKHYHRIADDIYRFTPLIQTPEDLNGVHNINERVSLANLERCMRFYMSLLEQC